jgi:predicted DNA-binding transcriptional regulator AlpA
LDPLLDAKTVKRDVGNISTMCLWRWTRDNGFPLPDLVLGGRRFWLRSSVLSWVDAQKERTRAKPQRRLRVGITRASRSDAVVDEPLELSAATPARVNE